VHFTMFEMEESRILYSTGGIMYTDSTGHMRQPLILNRLQEENNRKPRNATWCPSQIKMRAMASHLLTIQESERKRIASDLHDGLGQSLNMIRFNLAETEGLLADGLVDEMRESLARLKRNINGVIDEVRNAAMNLRPPMLDDLGILSTLS